MVSIISGQRHITGIQLTIGRLVKHERAGAPGVRFHLQGVDITSKNIVEVQK